MNTISTPNETSSQHAIEDAELEALVSALEAKWKAEREAREVSAK